MEHLPLEIRKKILDDYTDLCKRKIRTSIKSYGEKQFNQTLRKPQFFKNNIYQ